VPSPVIRYLVGHLALGIRMGFGVIGIIGQKGPNLRRTTLLECHHRRSGGQFLKIRRGHQQGSYTYRMIGGIEVLWLFLLLLLLLFIGMVHHGESLEDGVVNGHVYHYSRPERERENDTAGKNLAWS